MLRFSSRLHFRAVVPRAVSRVSGVSASAIASRLVVPKEPLVVTDSAAVGRSAAALALALAVSAASTEPMALCSGGMEDDVPAEAYPDEVGKSALPRAAAAAFEEPTFADDVARAVVTAPNEDGSPDDEEAVSCRSPRADDTSAQGRRPQA